MQWFRFPLFSLIALLPACGYQFSTTDIPAKYQTISIPYVINDSDGCLTQSVIRAVSEKIGPRYATCRGDLILLIEIIDIWEDNIGFRYDRNRKGKLTREVIPTESRSFITVEVQLIDGATSLPILGPVRLTEYLDFDHDYYESRYGENVLSLGQVIDLETARDTVQKPLYRLLANKIVEFVYESW